MKTRILQIVTLASCVACNDPEPQVVEPPSMKLDGTYVVQSIVSDNPVDLDHDGVFGVDLLEETHETVNSSRYYVVFSTSVYHWEPDFYDQQIFLVRPLANVFRDVEGAVTEIRYGFTNLLSQYRFDESTREVTVWRNLGSGDVMGVRMLSDEMLEITFSANYFTSRGWEVLSLKGIYKRK